MSKKLYMFIILISFSTIGLAFNDSSENKSSTKVMTQGLNHVALTVSKLDKSVAFFVDILGWRIAGGRPNYPATFVTDGKVFVTLWQVTNPDSFIKFDRKNNVGLHHLALTVAKRSDLDELSARFKKVDGVVIEFEPELNGKGPTVHMMIREPSGNRIEFAYRPQ